MAGLAVSEGIAIAPGILFDTSGRFSHHAGLSDAVWDGGIESAVRTVARVATDLNR